MIRERGITPEVGPQVRQIALDWQVSMQHFVNAVRTICLVP